MSDNRNYKTKYSTKFRRTSKGWFAGGQQLLPRSSQKKYYSGVEIRFKSALKLPARKRVVYLCFCLVWWDGTVLLLCQKKAAGAWGCSKPFSHAAEAGPQNISRGDATPTPSHPEGGDKNPHGHTGTPRGQQGIVFITLLHWVFGHTQGPNAWQIVLSRRTTHSPLSPIIFLLCKG